MFLATQFLNDRTFPKMVACHSPILDMDIPDGSEYNLLPVPEGDVPWLRWLVVGLSPCRVITTEMCHGLCC